MEDRRKFLKQCLIGCAAGGFALAAPGLSAYASAARPQNQISKRNPKRALVVWFSQTGHTRRIGLIIRHAWEKAGLTVDGVDYRKIDKSTLGKYDLIAMGTPVNYMDVPVNLKDWIKTLPHVDGASIAAYVTYGGKGDGQHNTACGLLERMTEIGGAAAGIGMFANMSTFAPTWSAGNAARTLKFKDLPNENTYRQARMFADSILANVTAGRTYAVDRKFGMDSLMTALPQIWLVKLLITNHHIDTQLCIGCETCIRNCPVEAIDLKTGSVNSGRCIACMGCVNNCPAQSMKMNFMGKPVYGFNEFLNRNRIEIIEPAELKT
jgi:ferredoxin/flavodoxin